MSRMIPTLTALVLAVALTGCSDQPTDPIASTTAPPPTATPTPAPTPDATSSAPAVATDAPPEVLLPADALGLAGEPRQESEGVVAWQVPESCGPVPPTGAVAMRTVTQGTGEEEQPVGAQQVAVFAGPDAAVAAVDELRAALTRCAQQAAGTETTSVVEDVAVGAQGVGLVTDYYGTSASGSLDDAMGTYLAATRRGSAVTLVATLGGEGQVGTVREQVVARTQQAWELLCRYDAQGC